MESIVSGKILQLTQKQQQFQFKQIKIISKSYVSLNHSNDQTRKKFTCSKWRRFEIFEIQTSPKQHLHRT